MKKQFLTLISTGLVLTFCASKPKKNAPPAADPRNPIVTLSITGTNNQPLEAITSTIYSVVEEKRFLKEFKVILVGQNLTDAISVELRTVTPEGKTVETKKDEFIVAVDVSSTGTKRIFNVKPNVVNFGTEQQALAGQYKVVALHAGKELASGDLTVFDFAFTNITKNDATTFVIGSANTSGLEQLVSAFQIHNCKNPETDIVYISSGLASTSSNFILSVGELDLSISNAGLKNADGKFSYGIKGFVADKADGFNFTAKITVSPIGKNSPIATDSIIFEKQKD